MARKWEIMENNISMLKNFNKLKNDSFTIEEMFVACGIHQNNKVFDENGIFLKGIYEGNNPQIIADTFFNGNIDELDSLCEKENCFIEAN